MSVLAAETIEHAQPHGRGPTWSGIRAIAKVDMRSRLRGRWRIVLGLWTLVLLALTGLCVWGFGKSETYLYSDVTGTGIPDPRSNGPAVFGAIVLVIAGLSLLVVPTFTATAINSERERGTLAVLQSTTVSAWDIVLGKLLAAWGSLVVLLLLTLPALLWAWAIGGISLNDVAMVLLALLLILATVAAVGLGMSALVPRPVVSSMLTYLVVGFLAVGTAILFALATSIGQESGYGAYQSPGWTWSDGTVHDSPEDGNWDNPPDVDSVYVAYDATKSRPDKWWWVLAPNPVVILADMTPSQPETVTVDGIVYSSNSDDALQALRDSIRDLRVPVEPLPQTEAEAIAQAKAEFDGVDGGFDAESPEPAGSPVWPWGLAGLVVLGGGAVVLAARRTRTPYRRLPRGVRVA